MNGIKQYLRLGTCKRCGRNRRKTLKVIVLRDLIACDLNSDTELIEPDIDSDVEQMCVACFLRYDGRFL